MEGKDNIIAYILDTARASADAIERAAAAKKENELAAYREKLSLSADSEREEAKSSAALILSRKESSARLDGAKLCLAEKQRLIDSVYLRVRQSVLNLSDAAYRELIGGYILKYASDGDEVIAAKKDAKRITAEFIKGLGDKKKITLLLSDETHGDDGGVILKSKSCDKNLTLSSLIKSVRDDTEGGVIKKLFKGD